MFMSSITQNKLLPQRTENRSLFPKINDTFTLDCIKRAMLHMLNPIFLPEVTDIID